MSDSTGVQSLRTLLDGERDPRARARIHKQIRAQRLIEARSRGTHTPEAWAALVVHFQGRCVRCGLPGLRVQKDHITPIYRGGSDAIDNLQPLCPQCNASKGPETTNWAAYRDEVGFEGDE